jgi:hypothetical protein
VGVEPESNRGVVLKTTDAGKTWLEATSNPPGGPMDIAFTDSKTAFIAAGELVKTVNGGATWTVVMSAGLGALNSIQCLGALKCYALANQGTLKKSLDGGITWDIFNLGIGPLQAMHFPDPHTGYVVGTNGTVAKLTNSDVIAVRPEASRKGASGYIRRGVLRYRLSKPSRVTVTVLDTRGRLRRELWAGNQSAGMQTLSLPRGESAPFLFIELRADGERQAIPWF